MEASGQSPKGARLSLSRSFCFRNHDFSRAACLQFVNHVKELYEEDQDINPPHRVMRVESGCLKLR